MEINKKELFLILACFIWIAPIRLPNSAALVFRCLLLCGIFFTQYVKPNPMLTLSILFVGFTVLSTCFFDRGITNLLKTVSSMAALLECILCASNPENRKAMPRGLLKGFALYFLIDAFMIFVLNGVGMNGDGQPLFFSGGKFNVSYMYLILMVLTFLQCKGMEIYRKLLMVVFGMFLAKYVDCSTGMIGILVFGLVMVLPEAMKEGKWKYVWFAGMIVVHYLIVFAQVQSTNPLVKYFITQVLHRQVHLTGRVDIYNRFGEIMEGHWLFGYGFTSSRIVEVTNLANTQNGFLQAIYIGGIALLIVFAALLIYTLYCISGIRDKKVSNILFSAFIAFMTIAIVEIPFTSVVFYIFLGIVYVYFCREKGEEHVYGITE